MHYITPSFALIAKKNRIRSKKDPNNTEKYFLFVTFADIITKNMNTSKKITVQNTEISVLIGNESDYICLTDMAHFKDKERTDYVIQNWLRTRSTIEYL